MAEFQILALDGGGIRGIFTAAVLAAIEEDCSTAVADHFDLIAGTSTGGLIALGLGLGIRPVELVRFYLEHGRSIFPTSFGLRSLRQWVAPKYSHTGLRHALQEIFGARTLGESSKRLLVASYNIGADDVYLFRTAHAARLQRDWKVEAWRIGMATTAAPTYFPACREVDGLRLVDGGLWADNPCMVALTESTGTLKVPLGSTRMLSVGTCDPVNTRPGWLDKAGRLGWIWHVPGVFLGSSSKAAVNQARFFLGRDRFTRVDPKVSAHSLDLDRVRSVQDLMGLARHHSRIHMPEIRERFLQHRAAPFLPTTTERGDV